MCKLTTVKKYLLAQKSDGKFLRLAEDAHTTSYDYVDEPELATRISLWKGTEEEYQNPKEAAYYFENSHRAREYWIKDCVMVAYEITTEVRAVRI